MKQKIKMKETELRIAKFKLSQLQRTIKAGPEKVEVPVEKPKFMKSETRKGIVDPDFKSQRFTSPPKWNKEPEVDPKKILLTKLEGKVQEEAHKWFGTQLYRDPLLRPIQ